LFVLSIIFSSSFVILVCSFAPAVFALNDSFSLPNVSDQCHHFSGSYVRSLASVT